MPPLANRLHEAFALELAAHRPVGVAYKRAGGQAKAGPSAAAVASRMLNRVDVQARVAELRAEAAARAVTTSADVLRGLAALAFTDPRELASWGPAGIVITDSADLTPQAAGLVKEISARTVTTTETIGKRERTTTTATVTLHLVDRKGALDSLGRALGMFVDRREISGPDQGPIPLLHAVAHLTTRQLGMLIEEAQREQAPA